MRLEISTSQLFRSMLDGRTNNNPKVKANHMNDELRPDYALERESEIFDEMIQLTVSQMMKAKPDDAGPLRAQHAKPTGCVKASFEITSDIPSELRHGVLREAGRSFDAVVRFSNGQGTIESDGDETRLTGKKVKTCTLREDQLSSLAPGAPRPGPNY